uniref:PHD finger protein 11 n=1 Tax=Crocodylus porosus TaxID=8502 RepID=A0A7M4E1L8_CROPO
MLVCPPPQLPFSCSFYLRPNGCIHYFVLYSDLTQVTSQIMAKMVRRRCAFCPEGEESSIMYISEEKNLAVHQDCLLYSSGFVESEEYSPHNLDIRFDVASVLSEIKRGKRLMCNFCRKKGATVGCEERACRRSYHYFCARCDDAAIETDEVKGIYRIDFLRKCKQAGLLDDIFEAMLDTLHLAQEKLMDDNTSETDFLLTTGTEEKIQELLETRKRLDTRIELLQDLIVVASIKTLFFK